MKGSPILATALACLIMLSMYVGMRVAFSDDSDDSNTVGIAAPDQAPSGQVSVYVEVYFSSLPKSFSLTHPATGKVLIKVDKLVSPEWSGDVVLPISGTGEKLTSEEIEILGNAEWRLPEAGYQFMQVIISPDELDTQSRTLRAESDINDVMTFQWKEEE